MLHIYYPSSARNVVALLLSLLYYLPTTTKRGHSKNPMSSSALWLTVPRTDHAAKKVLIQDNSWVVCPPERPQLLSSYRFLTSPSAQWGISVKFIDCHTTKRGELVLPLSPVHFIATFDKGESYSEDGVHLWSLYCLWGSEGARDQSTGQWEKKSAFRYQPQRPIAAGGVHRMWLYAYPSK